MKTVSQWAEQLPELIRIELLTQAKRQIKLDKNAIRLHYAIYFIDWVGLGYDFWEGVYYNSYDLETSADYIDETIPYTKEEVEAMILEFADPNDEVCKVMLANVFDNQIKDIEQNLGDNFKPLHETSKYKEPITDFVGDLHKENEALKREVEAREKEMQGMVDIINSQSYEKKELKSDIFYLEETIKLQEETIQTLTQMATTTPKKEQSIFFDLLEHIGLRK